MTFEALKDSWKSNFGKEGYKKGFMLTGVHSTDLIY